MKFACLWLVSTTCWTVGAFAPDFFIIVTGGARRPSSSCLKNSQCTLQANHKLFAQSWPLLLTTSHFLAHSSCWMSMIALSARPAVRRFEILNICDFSCSSHSFFMPILSGSLLKGEHANFIQYGLAQDDDMDLTTWRATIIGPQGVRSSKPPSVSSSIHLNHSSHFVADRRSKLVSSSTCWRCTAAPTTHRMRRALNSLRLAFPWTLFRATARFVFFSLSMPCCFHIFLHVFILFSFSFPTAIIHWIEFRIR